jgi:tryptophan-rich sensory protein
MNKIGKFIVSILVCQLAGIIGSFFTAPAIPTWYAELKKPDFVPPSWVFAPAWIFLFFLMGISLYLIWSKDLEKKEVRTSLFVFFIQLIFNILWSFLFFGLRSPLFGLYDIIILWFAIFVTILSFYRVSKWAAFLLIPYILWVSFATLLNFSIWQLNL